MRPKLEWTARAYEDLVEIYSTIALDNADAAERLLATIEQRVKSLVEHPRMGTRRPEIAESARVLVQGIYLVLYELHPDTNSGPVDEVEIVRVVHGMRDLSRLL
jgi:toxin ParE1/3/4